MARPPTHIFAVALALALAALGFAPAAVAHFRPAHVVVVVDQRAALLEELPREHQHALRRRAIV
jgi:hypothetical protein